MSDTTNGLAGDITVACRPVLHSLENMTAEERITATEPIREALLAVVGELATMRRAAVRELRLDGLTLREIGERVNMSPQRLHQIESGYRRKDDR
jgi:DNA-directed RNA polymerase specialized sigma24 family protein